MEKLTVKELNALSLKLLKDCNSKEEKNQVRQIKKLIEDRNIQKLRSLCKNTHKKTEYYINTIFTAHCNKWGDYAPIQFIIKKVSLNDADTTMRIYTEKLHQINSGSQLKLHKSGSEFIQKNCYDYKNADVTTYKLMYKNKLLASEKIMRIGSATYHYTVSDFKAYKELTAKIEIQRQKNRVYRANIKSSYNIDKIAKKLHFCDQGVCDFKNTLGIHSNFIKKSELIEAWKNADLTDLINDYGQELKTLSEYLQINLTDREQ